MGEETSSARAVARARSTKARTRDGSLRPGSDSTPDTTSTPQGRRVAIASATFSGERPPATMSRRWGAARRNEPLAPAQSKRRPVPPARAATRESISRASIAWWVRWSPGELFKLTGKALARLREVQHAQDAESLALHAGVEVLAQPTGERRIIRRVQLHASQPCGGHSLDNFSEGGVHEYAVPLDLRRKLCGDGANLGRG